MKSISATLIKPFALPLILTAMSTPALALDIFTGEPKGAYFNDFCPPIKEAGVSNQLEFNCQSSNGTLDNIDRVAKTPSAFGLAQYDLFASIFGSANKADLYTPVRDDIGKECLFLVTKNKLMRNYGDVASSAPYLNFILPPANSGHTGSFRFLQSIDADGLGKATKITNAVSTEDAITATLADPDAVTMLVQFPNPDSPLYKLVTANGGKFIPLISKNILAQTQGGRKIYTAEETQVTNPKWNESGQKLVTACTPIILFTGKTDAITDETVKTDHQKAITTLTAMEADDLRPKKDWFSSIWNGTKAASAKTVETMIETSEKAKEQSSPYIKKAKEVTEDAIEAAKPAYEKAKEKTKEALEAAKPTYEKAKEKTKEAMEAAKPTIEKAKETTKSFWEKTKEYGQSVVDYFSSEEKPAEPVEE